jgi:hypothetical protein
MVAECEDCGRWDELVFVPSGTGGVYLCNNCADTTDGLQDFDPAGVTLPASLESPQALLAKFALHNAAPDLLTALKSVEWTGQSEDGDGNLVPVCPYCDAVEDDGHEDGCLISTAIAKAEGRTNAQAEGVQSVRPSDAEAGQGASQSAEAEGQTEKA